MRQSVLAGISALLAAVLMPGWLLPAEQKTESKPLVLIVDQPTERKEEKQVLLKYRDQILTISLETYLTGVVLSEMPASFEPEALKAQAVAARTFALRQMAGGKHDAFDLCGESTCCQAWSSRETMEDKLGKSFGVYWSKAEQAVRDTEGEVLVYNDALIDAVYFSCSGGRTEDAVAVWGSEVPYLRSVPSDGEQDAGVYETQSSVSVASFCEAILDTAPLADLSGAPESWFGETTYTDGGGVDTMEIGGQEISGITMRRLFRLNSTMFELGVSGDEIVFVVKGYGHRVGMSQYCANAMAKDGETYREILSHYYSGAEVRKME